MKLLNSFELEAGKRYWLDTREDISGVFVRSDQTGTYFKEIQGNHGWYEVTNVLGIPMVIFAGLTKSRFYSPA
jgi:hypothetical protein